MKEMALKLIDYILLSEKGHYKESIAKYMELVDIARVDTGIYRQKLFDAQYANFDLTNEEVRKLIGGEAQHQGLA